MRTPDEIKKGLECRKREFANRCGDKCDTCDLYVPAYMTVERCADALALIQQLQAENAEKDARIQQLEAERDAAVADLIRSKDCYTCRYSKECKTGKFDCMGCEVEECPCHYCQYEWRGVQKEE